MGPEHAEFVPLGIGEDDPALVRTLPDVRGTGTEGDDALDLGDLVIGVQVDVQPILDRLLLGHPQEAEAGVIPLVAPTTTSSSASYRIRWSRTAAQNRARDRGSCESTHR
jgi:hypothetical protein